MRTLTGRLAGLEAQAAAQAEAVRHWRLPFPLGLTEEEAARYCHVLDRASDLQDRDPARRAEVLAILDELLEEGCEREEILARAEAAAGLTMAQVLARPDGPAILTGVADAHFAHLEGGDHADTPDPT